MKQSGLLILILVFGVFTVSVGQATWNAGLKAGLSLSDQSVIFKLSENDYQIETDPVIGPTVSFFLKYSRGKKWGIQLDAGYISKGSSTSTESITVLHLENNRIVENIGSQTTSNFRYVSVATVFQYRILNRSLTPFLVVGPRLDILVDYKTDSDYPLEDQHTIIPGLSIGGGVEYFPGRMGIFLEMLYQGDIIPVFGTEPMLINNHTGLCNIGLRYQL